MSPRTTGILLLVALGLGAFVWLWGVRGAESRREAEAREKRLFPDVEADAVESLALRTNDGRDARLERRDGRWRLVAPVDFPADETGVDGMASTLAQLQSESVIEEPQAASVYGLGDDARVVRFHVKDEDADRGLRIGKKTPVGASSYVATLGSDSVYVVPTWRVQSLEKPLDDLRERRVLRFDRDAVERIDASWPGGRVVLERAPAAAAADAADEQDAAADADPDAADAGEQPGGWRLVQPLQAEADEATVDGLLSDLAFLRADGFVDEPTPADEKALAKPEFQARLELASAGDAAPRTVAFELGATRDGKQRLARGTGPALYLVPAARLQDFPRSADAYRFKELARFVATDARSFELAFHPAGGGGEPTVVRGVRGEEGWTTEPEPMAPGKASRLVAELARLDASSVEADAMGREQLARLGLSPPRATIRVYGEPDEAHEGKPTLLASVDLGDGDPETGIAARRGDRPTVFRIDYELAQHLPLSLDAFRNRFEAQGDQGETATPPGSGSGEPGALPEGLPSGSVP